MGIEQKQTGTERAEVRDQRSVWLGSDLLRLLKVTAGKSFDNRTKLIERDLGGDGTPIGSPGRHSVPNPISIEDYGFQGVPRPYRGRPKPYHSDGSWSVG